MKNRIPAFSLIELLVVMVLSSVIVSIIYVIFHTVSIYQLDLSKNQELTGEVATCYFLMKKDFERCKLINASNNRQIVCDGFDVNPTVTYDFSDNYVLRKQHLRTDTFHLSFLEVIYSWNGMKVNTFPSVVDEMAIQVRSPRDTLNMHFIKEYDASSLLLLTNKDSVP
jgi:prepilin-type N-terminal cleavage/methylation domain-containing protein